MGWLCTMTVLVMPMHIARSELYTFMGKALMWSCSEKKARPPTGARRDLSQPAVKVPDEQQEWYTLSRDRRAQMAAHAVDELPKALDHRCTCS